MLQSIIYVSVSHFVKLLDEMSEDIELFEKLLKSYPRRLAAVKAAEGYQTEF